MKDFFAVIGIGVMVFFMCLIIFNAVDAVKRIITLKKGKINVRNNKNG